MDGAVVQLGLSLVKTFYIIKSVHVLNIFYMNDKRYKTLNLSIECHNLIITGQCRTGKTKTTSRSSSIQMKHNYD